MSDGSKPRWSRILLKLSGEAFAGEAGYGIDGKVVRRLAGDILEAKEDLGIEVAVVVGGGNIWRGMRGAEGGLDRAQADYMGMLATVINALALQDICEQLGVQTRLQSAIAMPQIAEEYIRRRAIRHLEKGRLVIFAAGTGNPFFTSYTSAAFRAVEIDAEVADLGRSVVVDQVRNGVAVRMAVLFKLLGSGTALVEEADPGE